MNRIEEFPSPSEGNAATPTLGRSYGGNRFRVTVVCAAITVASLLWLAMPGILRAQQDASIKLVSDAEYSFGQALRFSLVASGSAPISQVTLFMHAPELPNTLTAEIATTGGEEIEVTHVVDLAQLRLAPFTTVTYWWSIEDDNGVSLESERRSFDYVDDQFEWHDKVHDGVQVFWTGEDPAVGQAALDAVATALPKIQAIVPIDTPELLRVFVYPTASDLRAGLRLTGRDWVGAHAHPELGVILVSASSPLTAAADLAQSIPHELTHLYVYKATGVGYEATPLWFDEGLASLLESAPNPNYRARLEEATALGDTLAFADLCYTLPSGGDQALLAYAQSASFVRYIQAEYGNQALQRMIGELVDGADCQSVTERALGVSLSELNQGWLEHETPQSVFQRLWRNGRAWLAIVAAGFLLLGLLVVLPKGKRR